MNNQKIAALQQQLNELASFRNSTTNAAMIEIFDKQIDAAKKELAALNPASDIATSLTSAVNDRVDSLKPADVFLDMHPVIAIKCINGAAMSVIRHVLYRNRVHEAIMARNSMNVTAGTSAWKRTEHSTSPYESEEDTLLAITDEVKSSVEALAQLLCDHNATVERAIRENVKLDVSGSEGHRAGYDEFPSVRDVMRMDEASKQRKAAEARVRGDIARAVAPNVVATLIG